MRRPILFIDEGKCDGCGECIPACQEGALQIVNGKVRLIADNLCDGLGACLGQCPQRALIVETRDAEDFDEEAVAVHLKERSPGQPVHRPFQAFTSLPTIAACPSSQFLRLGHDEPSGRRSAESPSETSAEMPSQLAHWPVQLRLLPPTAPVLSGASLLLCADCVPFVYPAFHQNLLRGRAVAVACPKLDDPRGHLEKLTEILRQNEIRDVTVARMQVPCCSGLLMMAIEARRTSGRRVPIVEMVVGTRGEIVARHPVQDPIARDVSAPALDL